MKGIREPNLSRDLGLNTILIGPFYAAAAARYNIRDAGARFVARQAKVPWSYLGTNFGTRYETGAIADPVLDPPSVVDERAIWGSDLVVHLHDDADGGVDPPAPSNRLRLRMRISGYAPNGRYIEEFIWIAAEDKDGDFVSDSYYRTKFAYQNNIKCRLLEFYGTPTNDDYFEIGYNSANQYNVRHRTNAHYRRRKYGIPWRCKYLEDIMCVKIDPTPTGTGLNDALPDNVRGMYPIDLIKEGAIYDAEDGSIMVNECEELKMVHEYEAEGTEFNLIGVGYGNVAYLFQIDPRNPHAVQPQDTRLFYDNERDFYSAPINP